MTLTDRFLTCSEEPTKGQHCEWVTALAIAGYAAAAAGLAHDVQGFVSGKTPWDNPGEWTTGALKAGAMGFGGGLLGAGVGAAVGPMLGAGAGATGGGAGGAVGGAEGAAGGIGGMTLAEGASGLGDALSLVGQGTGTIAAEAGAATPSTVAGVIPNQSGQFLSAGTQAPQGMVREALKNVAQNTVSGSITGGLKDPENFGRGALMGAAGGAASSAFSSGASALFRGQGAGIVPNSVDGPNRGFSMMGGDGGFHQAYNPNTASGGFDNFMESGNMGYDPGREAFSVSRTNIATPPPTLAERATNFGIKQGSSLAGSAARMGVGNMMQPNQPPDPMSQNPYAQYGQTPYWMRRM